MTRNQRKRRRAELARLLLALGAGILVILSVLAR